MQGAEMSVLTCMLREGHKEIIPQIITILGPEAGRNSIINIKN